MAQYKPEQLAEILAEHRKWLMDEGGKCAYLRGAYLRGADLRGADLRGADLSGADLRGAYLRGADLSGKTISTVIARVTRSDGYEFIAFDTDAGIVIRAGCRTFSPEEYREHIAVQYPDTDKATETADILNLIELRASRLK